MSWRERLLGLALAGGLVASCSNQNHIPPCNANPDPCCLDPNSQQCFDYHHPEAGIDAPIRDGAVDAEATDAGTN